MESNSHSPPSPFTITTPPLTTHHESERGNERRYVPGGVDGHGGVERKAAPQHVESRASLHVAYRGEEPPPALAPPDPARTEGGADPGGASPHPPAPGEAAPVLPGAGALNPETPVGGGTGDGAAVLGGGLPGRGTPGQGTPPVPALPALPLLFPWLKYLKIFVNVNVIVICTV